MLHTPKQHKNARLTPVVRREMIQEIEDKQLTQQAASDKYNVHRNTVRKWVKDSQENGNWLCMDKKSTPEKYRLSSGLQYVNKVADKIQRSVERKRMLYTRCQVPNYSD